MERILVGVDGSPESRTALAWAADLARRGGLDLFAARVFEPTEAEVPPGQGVVMHQVQRAALNGWCAELPDDGPRPFASLLDGNPPDALLAEAAARRADLLVVGGRGRGGVLDLHLGSVAHHLTHHTTLPLAIVPVADPVQHLVVGVDGSPGSLRAVEVCADLAARLDVGVTAVHAFEPFAEWVPDSDPRGWRTVAEDDLRTWTLPIEKEGVPLELHIERDVHPVAAIGRAMAEQPGALVVVGARGLGGLSGLRLGRVPLQLVHRAGTSVVVVPADTTG